jgi:hypothetical protein
MYTNNIDDVLENYGIAVNNEQEQLTQDEIEQIYSEELEELSGH